MRCLVLSGGTPAAVPEGVIADLKARRLQAKIDTGECVSVRTAVVVGPEESIEDAKARALARYPVPDDGRAVHREFFFIFTGVPSEGIISHPSKEPDRNGASCSQPAYVRVTISNGDDDGDPGRIAEGYYTIENGAVVLRDPNDKHLTSRALLKDEAPLAVARALLREAEEPKDFARPIRYPKLGLA